MCLLRIKFVRAQHEDQDYVNPELQALYDEFVNLFNGDLRHSVVQHYCYMPGCCEGHQRKVVLTRCVGLLSAALFSWIGVDLPAENRWYTFGPHLARQCSGMLTHRILGRVVALAFTARPRGTTRPRTTPLRTRGRPLPSSTLSITRQKLAKSSGLLPSQSRRSTD
jgi:hypothetical protein